MDGPIKREAGKNRAPSIREREREDEIESFTSSATTTTTTMLEQKLERSTSFSVTCNRLSQYLRETGGLGIAPRTQQPPTNGLFRQPATMWLLPGAVAPADDPTTETTTDGIVSGPKTRKSMNLFPQHAGFGAADDKKAELTIFYCGKVLLFDDFPADKARDLMLMAQSFNSATSAVADRPPTVTSGQSTACAKHVPIARRASLHRFLEKRKDRINSKAPYNVVNSSAKPVEVDPAKATEIAQPWLGLGQQLSTPAMSYNSRR